MKFLLSVLLLALSCCFVHGDILFTRKSPPSGWSLGPRADPSQSMSFLIALKQSNLDQLEEKFWSVSDPISPFYQQFMTKEEIMNLIKPIDTDYQIVIDWLSDNGLTNYLSYGDALQVKATAYQCELLFSTIIHQYKNNQNGQTIYRQYGTFSVPSHIKERIDAVFGISTFPMPRYIAHKGKINNNNNNNNNMGTTDNPVGVVAQTLYGLYNMSHQTAGKDSRLTSQAVIEFEGQNFAPSDLSTYASLTGIPIQSVPSNQIIGPNDPTQTGTESTLDIDFIATVNIQASNWFWIEPGNNWLYAFAVHFFNTTSIPQVISISYGWYEGAECDINPTECSMIGVDAHGYVNRVNTEFLKIGLRGVSILVASGDSGAHTRTDPDCTAPTLRSEFPAGSPYVTTVGATQLQNTQLLPSQPAACTSAGYSCASSGTEVAVSYDVAMFASGGGFSEVASQPSYQKTAVSRYLRSGIPLPPSSYYNATNRGQPDVSAVGNNNLIYQGGMMQAVGGTSAATPIFAAVISLLNELSIIKTGHPLGFLNPLLYKMWEEMPNTFNDITSGDNKCTEDGCASTCQGWYATKGWDPVTGLGTPNVGHMLAYLEKQFE